MLCIERIPGMRVLQHDEANTYVHCSSFSHHDRESEERGELFHNDLVPVLEQRGSAR